MYNKFKVKKKIIYIALALVMTASSVASLPMNVFAGNVYPGKQKNAATTASPHVVYDFDIKNVIELDSGQTFNLNDHVTNIRPQGAAFEYVIEYLFANTEIFDIDRKVINPGIAKFKVDVGNVSKEAYIVADINGILAYAADAANTATEVAYNFSNAAKVVHDVYSAYNVSNATEVAAKAVYVYAAHNVSNAVKAAYDAAEAAYDAVKAAYDAAEAAKVAKAAKAAKVAKAAKAAKAAKVAKAAKDAKTAAKTAKTAAIVAYYAAHDAAKAACNVASQTAWNVAKNACEEAKTALDGGLNLEAQLKIAYMAYRVAEAVLTPLKDQDNKSIFCTKCKEREDALQEVINACYKG